MLKLLKTHKALIAILILGIFLRVYKFPELFQYSHDQDLIGWFVRDIVFNHNLKLIGQQTSQLGVFIGPLFYYAIIPFYWLTNWDPIGGIYLVAVINIATIFSFYFVFTKMFRKSASGGNKKVGLIAALIYSVSLSTVLTSREVVPTTPVMLWSVWFLYSLHLLLKANYKSAFPILGVLIGLVWHINMGLALLLPLPILASLLSNKPISVRASREHIKPMFAGLVLALFFSLPLIIFEFRNDFLQTNAIFNSILGNAPGATPQPFSDKLHRVIQLVNVNIRNLLWGSTIPLPEKYHLYVPATMFFLALYKKLLNYKLTSILVAWVIIFIAFFTFNSIIISEYYLNGMNVVWILIISLVLGWLLDSKYKAIGVVAIGLFVSINITRFINIPINKSGYLERKSIVAEIARDSRGRDYPCIAISYITSPGNDLGYRYFFWLQDMHVNHPKSLAPVYSIVFPHSLVDKIDKSFGALGLIYPDYERYAEEDIKISCSGQNSNLTDPLFGYTN